MNKSLKIVLIVVALAVVVAVLSGYLGKKGKVPSAKRPSFANIAIPVESIRARKGDLEKSIEATGDVTANDRVSVYSKVEGRIMDLPVDMGDYVKKGQFLAKVEDDELKARVAKAKAELEMARARWAQMKAGLRPQELEEERDNEHKAEAEYKNSGLNLKRAEELFRKGFIAPQQLDEARLKHTSASDSLNTAREKLKMAEEGYRVEDRQAALAQVHQAEANLRMAEIKLAETRITAPINGVISERMVDQGAFVHASTGILSIVDMDVVKVLVNLSEKDIPHIGPGKKARIRVDAYPAQVFTGTVEKVSPVVDPENRTAETEIYVDNKDHKLKPGMFARAKMILAKRAGAIIVPASALKSSNGQSYLFIHENGRAHKRTVIPGMKDGDVVEVVDNLNEGEEVIVAGLNRLKDNSPVKVVNVRNGK